jgi:hypothetical protein
MDDRLIIRSSKELMVFLDASVELAGVPNGSRIEFDIRDPDTTIVVKQEGDELTFAQLGSHHLNITHPGNKTVEEWIINVVDPSE